MNRISNRVFGWSLVLALCSLLIIACQDPIEGCLDVEATNYMVSADDPCTDCCTYPTLSLQVFHSFQDSFNFSYDSAYTFEGNVGQFEQVIFYLSDFRLLGSSDTLLIADTMSFDIVNGSVEVLVDDFTIVSRSIGSITYEVGEIRGSGQFDSLSFVVGLSETAATVDAEAVIADHPLSVGEDTLWTDIDGYSLNRVIIIPDTTDSTTQRQFDIRGASNLQRITLPFSTDLSPGFSILVPIKIDYQKWFSGINFVGETNSDITAEIVSNTTNAFSIND